MKGDTRQRGWRPLLNGESGGIARAGLVWEVWPCCHPAESIKAVTGHCTSRPLIVHTEICILCSEHMTVGFPVVLETGIM